jgi:hypothetical protein
LWEAFFDPSDYYFLFAEERGKNKMNCELMLTYDTPALRQTGSSNLTGPKTLSTHYEATIPSAQEQPYDTI